MLGRDEYWVGSVVQGTGSLCSEQDLQYSAVGWTCYKVLARANNWAWALFTWAWPTSGRVELAGRITGSADLGAGCTWAHAAGSEHPIGRTNGGPARDVVGRIT